ncbi:hypothetical protein N8564_04035 [Verrucomicrobiales bacterium]|jgi:hypothetical protein|nr:hypothetical protein [Verrucomicrobiales bacterium]
MKLKSKRSKAFLIIASIFVCFLVVVDAKPNSAYPLQGGVVWYAEVFGWGGPTTEGVTVLGHEDAFKVNC